MHIGICTGVNTEREVYSFGLIDRSIDMKNVVILGRLVNI